MIKNEIGYYTVNDTAYGSKFEAVIAAQQSNSEIKWHYFHEVFSKVNWFDEPTTSLDELYRIRAQQIRDAYDYIVVYCSGGADSNNVIRTFMNNNIHVDEVVGIAPMNALKNWNFDSSNISSANTISETKFALLPLFNEISTRSPKTKVTIHDYFDEMTHYKDEQWLYEASGNVSNVLSSHMTDVLKFNHIDKVVQQGKRVALLYGIDKPVIRILPDDGLYYVLADATMNYVTMPKSREHPNIDRVMFYISPDLPELMVKQAHVAARVTHMPQNRVVGDSLRHTENERIPSTITFHRAMEYQAKNNIKVITKENVFNYYMNKLRSVPDKDTKISLKTAYQRMLVPYIYPTTYTKNLFQCQKINIDAGFFTGVTGDQSWIHSLHGNTRVSEMIVSGTKALYDSISPKYLNMKGTGFLSYFNLYKFGTSKSFTLEANNTI